jgi:hypothetical protein
LLHRFITSLLYCFITLSLHRFITSSLYRFIASVAQLWSSQGDTATVAVLAPKLPAV